MAKIVLGVFDNRSAVYDALITLEDNGYSGEEIHVVIKSQLPDLGLSSEDIKLYKADIKKGNILFAVSTLAGREEEIKNILLDYGAKHLKTIAKGTDIKNSENNSDDGAFVPVYYSETEQLPKNKRKTGK